MKIHPPRVTVDDNDPFKEALFGRKEFGESLTNLVRSSEEGLVIFINAPWGEGKTTFAQMWRSHLKGQKLDAIYFDAYACDYLDDPFVAFSGEILGLVDRRLSEIEGIPEARKAFTKAAAQVGKRLAGLGVKVGLRALTMGAVDAADVAALKDIGSEVATGISEVGAEFVERRIEDYSKEKDGLKAFKESLAKLAAHMRATQGFPLTIIVDELDRCRPDFALGLLERIKHLFDVDGVVFVLLVNQEQLEGYVQMVYGDRVDARGYLLKFANVFVDLPSQHGRLRQDRGYAQYCLSLFEHYGITLPDDENPREFADGLSQLTQHFGLTLREIEKVFASLSLYYASLPKGQLSFGFLVIVLAILKVKRPKIYWELARKTMDVGRLFTETKLDQIDRSVSPAINQDWASDLIRFCLLSDAEMEAIPRDTGPRRMGSFLYRYNINRTDIIPFLCARLNRFSASTKG